MFSVFDVDRDGFITVEEVLKVLESMGFQPSQSSIDDIFRQVDLDGSTTVSTLSRMLQFYGPMVPIYKESGHFRKFIRSTSGRNGHMVSNHGSNPGCRQFLCFYSENHCNPIRRFGQIFFHRNVIYFGCTPT